MSHAARAHAKLSPSGAHRWMHCPGSIRMSAGIEETSSVFADEGTAAHMLAEHCLANNEEPADLKGGSVHIHGDGIALSADHIPEDGIFAIDDDMVDAVSVFVDTVRKFAKGAEFELETKLDLRHIPGMEFGTGDALIYHPDARHLFVCDYKHGRGVPVEVEDNPQLLTYALGAARRYHNRGVDTVTLVVVQPRCPHPDGSVRMVEFSALDLVDFTMLLAAAAEATADPDAPLHAGDWCRFCPAAGACPEQERAAFGVAGIEFGDEPPVVADMPEERLAEVLRRAGVLKDWIKRVEARAHQAALDGKLPGFKLVASRATRKWVDDDSAIASELVSRGLDEDKVWAEPSIKSPAQMEKTFGRKHAVVFDDLITKVSSGTILVPEDDPRPPAKATAEADFA